MKFKAHPLIVLKFLKPILFILPLPYLRMAVIYFISGSAEKLGFSVYFTILAVVFLAIARYKTIYMYINEKTIVAKRGFFSRQSVEIPIKNISFVKVRQNLLDFAFLTATLSIYTEGAGKGAAFEIKLKKGEAERVLNAVYREAPAPTARVDKKRLIITAAATSSAVGGLLVIVPATNRIGKLLGGANFDNFYSKVAGFTQGAANIFPPAVNILTILLAIGFAVSFIYAVLRLFSMRVSVGKNRCEVHFGLFVRTQKAFLVSSAKSVVLERPLRVRLLKKYSARLDLGGRSGAEALPLLSGAEYKELFSQNKGFSGKTKTIRPKQTDSTRNRFLFMPALLLLGVAAFAVVFAVCFGKTGRAAAFFTAILGGVVLYYGIIRLYEYKWGKLYVGKTVHICTCSALLPKEIYAEKENVAHIIITRLVPDLFKSTCRVKIAIHSKKAPSAAVRHVYYNDAQKTIQKEYNIE